MNMNDSNNSFYEIDCSDLGPDTLLSNTYFVAFVYVMYSVIFITSLIGNTFVCYIVLSSPRMRTVTNFFILNLSFGDILVTILCVPITCVSMLKNTWLFGPFLCPTISYVQAVSVFVSAYTLVAISIDKYVVIMWPLKPRITKSLASGVIGLIWILAGTTVLPSAIYAELVQPNRTFDKVCDRYLCKEIEWGYIELYSKILMFLQYIIPCSVMLFTYTSIAIVIWCHRIPGEAENLRDMRIARSKRKMIKMMVTVVFVYTLCWLPFNLLQIFPLEYKTKFEEFLYFAFHMLAMSHACYNPIIYCYMNSRFKDGLYTLLRYIPCSICVSSLRKSSKNHHAGEEGTESTLLHRINTCTTYVSMKKKQAQRASSSNIQPPIRSASVVRGTNHAVSRKNSKNVSIGDLEL